MTWWPILLPLPEKNVFQNYIYNTKQSFNHHRSCNGMCNCSMDVTNSGLYSWCRKMKLCTRLYQGEKDVKSVYILISTLWRIEKGCLDTRKATLVPRTFVYITFNSRRRQFHNIIMWCLTYAKHFKISAFISFSRMMLLSKTELS